MQAGQVGRLVAAGHHQQVVARSDTAPLQRREHHRGERVVGHEQAVGRRAQGREFLDQRLDSRPLLRRGKLLEARPVGALAAERANFLAGQVHSGTEPVAAQAVLGRRVRRAQQGGPSGAAVVQVLGGQAPGLLVSGENHIAFALGVRGKPHDRHLREMFPERLRQSMPPKQHALQIVALKQRRQFVRAFGPGEAQAEAFACKRRFHAAQLGQGQRRMHVHRVVEHHQGDHTLEPPAAGSRGAVDSASPPRSIAELAHRPGDRIDRFGRDARGAVDDARYGGLGNPGPPGNFHHGSHTADSTRIF